MAESQEPETTVLEAVEIGAVRAVTGGLLLSGQAGGDVEGALNWSLAGRDESGRIDVPFVIEVDGGKLLEGRSARRVAIGIYAYVVDGEGRVVDFIAQGLVLDSEAYRDKIIGSGLKFVGRFFLEPGDFTLRVMVQNNATGNYYMSWSILALPAADDLSPQLLPPLVSRSGDPMDRRAAERRKRHFCRWKTVDGTLPCRQTDLDREPTGWGLSRGVEDGTKARSSRSEFLTRLGGRSSSLSFVWLIPRMVISCFGG